MDYADDSIVFGYSGGIANMTTEYHLLENGNLFKKAQDNTFESLKKVSTNQCKQLFNNIDFLGLEKILLKDPGNKTNFLRIKKNETEHEMAWGGNQNAPSDKVTLFYASLMNLVKKEN